MRRLFGVVSGLSALLVGGLALGPGDVRAGGEKKTEKTIEKKVEKNVERSADDKAVKKVHRRVMRLGVQGGGLLGVGLEEVEGSEARGAAVRSVTEGGAAAEAGIEEGDVIVRFDGEAVRSAAQLARLVRETPAGRAVAIEVERGGATRTLSATLAERSDPWPHLGGHGPFLPEGDFEIELPEPPAHLGAPPLPGPHVFEWKDDGERDFTMLWGPERPRRLGVRYMEIGDQLAEYFGLNADEGVLVTSVDDDGPAAKAGLRAGDVILELDGKAIRRGRDLREQVSEAEDGEELAIRVQRRGEPLDLTVTLAKPEPRRRAGGASL